MEPQPPHLPPAGGKPGPRSAARAGAGRFCTQCGGPAPCTQCRPGGGGAAAPPPDPPPPQPRPRARMEEETIDQPVHQDRGERVPEWDSAARAMRRRGSDHRERGKPPSPPAEQRSRRRRHSAADAGMLHHPPPPPPLPPPEPPAAMRGRMPRPGGQRRHSEPVGQYDVGGPMPQHQPPQQLPSWSSQPSQLPPHLMHQPPGHGAPPALPDPAAGQGALPPVAGGQTQLVARRASEPLPQGYGSQWFGGYPGAMPHHAAPPPGHHPHAQYAQYGGAAHHAHPSAPGLPPFAPGAPGYPAGNGAVPQLQQYGSGMGGAAPAAAGYQQHPDGSVSSLPVQQYMQPAPPPAGGQLVAAPAGGGGAPGGGPELGPLQAALDRFGVSIAEADDLVCLADWDVIIIIDDSSSMRLAAEPAAQRRLDRPIPTRWDELCSTLLLLVDVAAHFDRDGLDIYFLNQPPLSSVQGSDDIRLRTVLDAGPKRGTPLTEALLTAVREHSAGDKCEKPALLLIFTDGEPTGEGGVQGFVSTVGDVVKGRVCNGTYRIQILACTDDERSIAYLNELDSEYEEVDVTDDYYSELKEVQAAKRTNRFTRGDWAMKALLAPVSKKFDDWDEEGDARAPLTTPTQKDRYRST